MELTKKQKIIFNIVAAISITILCFAISPKTMQNDTYYTVKIGSYILENGINMMDPFSWHETLPYTFPHWMYDVIMNLIYQVGNWDGIYVSTCVFAVFLGLVMYFTNVKISKNNLTSLIFTLISIYLLKDFIAARAQLVTFILFALEVFCLEKFVEKPKKIYGAVLILISLLIANLHCAVWPFFFCLFMPYIVEYLFLLYYDSDIAIRIFSLIKRSKIKLKCREKASLGDPQKMIQQEKEKLKQTLVRINEKRTKERQDSYKIIIQKNKNIKYLIIVLILCVLMGFLTPIKDTPFTYLIKTIQGNTTKNINEHLPIVFWENQPMLCVYALLIALLTFTKTKIKLRDLFMLGGLMLLTIISKRQSSMLLVIGLLIFNKYVSEFLQDINFKKTLNNISKTIGSFIGGILVICIIGLIGFNLYKDKKDDEYISKSTYPVDACDFILQNIDLSKAKFFNEYNYGSYMLYRDIPVFIDSRADLYAPEFNNYKDIFSDFLNISNMGTDYEEKFDEYGITHVILYQDAKLNYVLEVNNKYNQIYSDKYFVIYERL